LVQYRVGDVQILLGEERRKGVETLKRIELARALMGTPKLLMLDEPASGLFHSEVDSLAADIRALRDKFNLTVLLVEHHMRMVMAISEKIVVMNFGRKIQDGDPDVVRKQSGCRNDQHNGASSGNGLL
jgi:ABC-type branched-subunit amino acid transport system ATPase component